MSAPLVTGTPDPAFPARLQDVPVESRLTERFGWGPMTLGILFMSLAVSLMAGAFQGRIKIWGYVFLLISLAVAIFCARYEVRRRANRAVLFPLVDKIGIYRKGALEIVVDRTELRLHELPEIPIRHLLRGLGFLCLGPIGIYSGLTSSEEPLGMRLLMIIGGAGVTSLGASVAWTRLLCDHFLIPKVMDKKLVVFTKSDLKRLYGNWP